MFRYTYNLRALYETPALVPEHRPGLIEAGAAERIFQNAHLSGQTILSELDAKELLRAYGIPVVQTRFAGNADEAVKAADEAAIGFDPGGTAPVMW